MAAPARACQTASNASRTRARSCQAAVRIAARAAAILARAAAASAARAPKLPITKSTIGPILIGEGSELPVL
jgi:hypothetical protein